MKWKRVREVSLSFLKEGLKDAPWKLNIETLLMQYYEKATVKENFLIIKLIQKGKKYNFVKNFFYESA